MLEYGVKFCGGCNPRYDRRKIYDMLLDIGGEKTVSFILDGEECKNLIVLAGCSNNCADISNISVKENVYNITDEKEGIDLIQKLFPHKE